MLAQAAQQSQRGERVHCVGDRAHILRFDVAGEENDGSSLHGIERAIITLEPSPAHGEFCDGRNASVGFTPEGMKQFCYGANQDSSCTGAAAALPINDHFDCKDCFAAVSADAFYMMDYSITKLNRLQVGINNSHVRASASLHTLLQGEKQVASGSIPVFGSQKATIIYELVGCPVCVKAKIQVGAPTSIDYDLSVSGEVDLQAGMALDVALGDNFVVYDSDAGWSHATQQPTVSATPLLTASANFEGDFSFGVTTQLQVEIDDIFWYHLTLNPSIPGTLKFNGDATVPNGDLCLDATAKFTMTQEADLDWDLKVWQAKDHWGPSQLWSWAIPTPLHSCKHFGAASAPSAITV
jgi:hypothetical protein